MADGTTRILGIDPGLETTGISILDIKGNEYIPVYCGCIVTGKEKPLSARLEEIYQKLNQVISKYNPESLAIEQLFFNVNVKTALSVGLGLNGSFNMPCKQQQV